MMSIRPFRDIYRKKTKVIKVGSLNIGGDNPISVQSMTNTLTKDKGCLLYTSPSPRDLSTSRMPSSA